MTPEARRGALALGRGLDAEAAAARLCAAAGGKILARRAKTPHGEIDLICAEPSGALVFVEVKARARMEAALEALTARQGRRLEAAALFWLAAQAPGFAGDLRFDLIAMDAQGRLTRLENVWLAAGL